MSKLGKSLLGPTPATLQCGLVADRPASNKSRGAGGLWTQWVPGCVWSRPQSESAATLQASPKGELCVFGRGPSNHQGRQGEGRFPRATFFRIKSDFRSIFPRVRIASQMGGATAHPLWTRIQHVPFVRVEDETDVQLERMAKAGWEFIRRSEGGYDGAAWVQCQTCGTDVRASQFVHHCVIRYGSKNKTSECAIRAS